MSTATMPLPSLQTMVALCREARDDLLDDIKSHPELGKERWRVPRSPCLYALDAQGNRLNDGTWCAWERRKSDVEGLLARYPDAHAIIVDGGIDVAANLADYEASHYEPQFWQATIWKRDAPVHSLEDIDGIVRRRTGFTGVRDLLHAKGGYRPSFDMRDTEMAVLAEFYDEAMARRGDDRRAYRYGNTSLTAVDLIGRYRAVFLTDDTGEGVHEALSKDAANDFFDDNTGGFVWLSHTLHRAGAHLLHVCAGSDSVRVLRAQCETARECADALYALCGEDEHLLVGEYFAGDDATLQLDDESPTEGMRP